jgi:hypothetical protein
VSSARARGPGVPAPSGEASGERARGSDPFAEARRLADAVLYEGYVLYPYRASAAKNRCRWQFGVCVPRAHAEAAQGSDPSGLQASCVAEAPPGATVRALVRFLQVQARELEAFVGPGQPGPGQPGPGQPGPGQPGPGPSAVPVASLEVDGQPFVAFDEAVAHEVELPPTTLPGSVPRARSVPIELDGSETEEILRDRAGAAVGRLVRRRHPVRGVADLRLERCGAEGRFARITVHVRNETPYAAPAAARDEVARHAFVALHVLLAVEPGRFVSMVDPPEAAAGLVASSANAGLWPVLVGRGDDVVLAAPMILPDHAEVAPESPGDLFDATEIDELLALRVMTLTDEEKREAVATDPRAAEVVARCDGLGADGLGSLHGAIRELRRLGPAAPPADGPSASSVDGPSASSADGRAESRGEALSRGEPAPGEATATVGGRVVRRGDKVRLSPSRLQDAQDLFLKGRLATVQEVLVDLDGGVHVAVSVDDDPASDLEQWYGRYRYFRPEELECFRPEELEAAEGGS